MASHDDRIRALVAAIYDLLIEGSVHAPSFQDARRRRAPSYMNAEAAAHIVIDAMADGLGRLPMKGR